MDCSYLNKSLKKLLFTGLFLLLLAPAQALAKDALIQLDKPEAFECNPTLSIETVPPGIQSFHLGDTITLSADLGAGNLGSGAFFNDFMELSTFGIGRDCANGDSFTSCISQGNDVQFMNVVSTDCKDSAGDPVIFNTVTRAANSVYTDFTTGSGLPIKFGTLESCNVEFNLKINQLNSSSSTIFQVIGFTNSDATCVSNDFGPTSTGSQESSISYGIVVPNIAAFIVSKDFTDDNPMLVEVQISCNTGLPIESSKMIKEGVNNEVSFVVEKFEPGELNCDVIEVVPQGYSESYSASKVEGVSGPTTDDSLGCHFEQVEGGVYRCDITNDPDPVEIIVHKEWIDLNLDFLQPDAVYITLHCNDPILHDEGDQEIIGQSGFTTSSAWIDPDDPGNWWVIPPFNGSGCWVTEQELSDFEGDVSDCDNLFVELGQGEECTVVNTRFFEGIPTLNQFGIALLALLMLGIGVGGFRRFF